MDLIVLADSDGVVDMTHEAIARTTNRPIEIIRSTILELEGPDNRSRTSDADGARLKRLDDHRDWGWIILNFDKFRETATDLQRREKTKLRTRKYRENIRKQSNVTHCDAAVTPPYASAYASDSGEREVQKGKPCPTTIPPQPTRGISWEDAQKWLLMVKGQGADYTRQETHSAWLALEANGWMWGKNPVIDYRSALERQIQTDRAKNRNGKAHREPDYSRGI